MKRKISTLIIACSLAGVMSGQEQEAQPKLGTYSAGARLVHLYDIGAYRFDTELSKDLKGLNGEFTGFNIGLDMYGEKQFTPLFGLQGGFRFGGMNGSNETEHYQNSFFEFYSDMIFILSNMDRDRLNAKFNYYGKMGLGVGGFKAERFLNSDESLNNRIKSGFWEARLGAGVQYKFSESIRFEADIAYNMVLDDGFDGFDNASGRDPYLSTGIGVAYTFGNVGDKPMYAVNFFSEDYAGAENARMLAEMKAEQENAGQEQRDEFSEFSARIDSLLTWQSARIEELAAQNKEMEEKILQQQSVLATGEAAEGD